MFLIILLILLVIITIVMLVPTKCNNECYTNKLVDYQSDRPKNYRKHLRIPLKNSSSF